MIVIEAELSIFYVVSAGGEDPITELLLEPFLLVGSIFVAVALTFVSLKASKV